jgi:hypothetical protein
VNDESGYSVSTAGDVNTVGIEDNGVVTCTCVENIQTAVTCQNVVAHTRNEYFIITSACEGVVVFIT